MMNFACFDLTAYARWLSSIGIGLGTPDTYHFKDSLTDEVYPLFLQYGDTIPVGPDVQWANYERNAMPVVDIRDFAIDAMNPWYMFWRIREPYFSDEVLQAVHSRKLPRAQKFYTAGSGDRRPMPPVIDN